MSEAEQVKRSVQEARAIRWWIDEQIRKGRSDDEIMGELYVAVAFITGKLGPEDLKRGNAA